MLNKSKAFSSFSTSDIEKAKAFYSDTLEIETSSEMEGTLSLNLSGGNQVFIYPKPDHQPATFTVLNFQVDNLEETVDQLTAKGIQFEQYEGQIKTDAKGIFRDRGMGIAWFKDPAGNILSVIESK